MDKTMLKDVFSIKAAVILTGHPQKLEALIMDLMEREKQTEVGVAYVKLSAAPRLEIIEKL